jgi:hypothetical protein
MRPIAMAVPLLFATLAAATARADPPAAQPEERRICRGGERQLGTRMRTPRRCRTAEQWRQEDESRDRIPVGLQTTQGQNDGRAPAQPR